MPRTKEEILEKAKLARRERYAKIKSDPEKYAQEREKERQRYLRRKESKKILSIQDLSPKAKKVQRKKWRDNFKKYYQRKLLFKRGQELMDVNTPSDSETDPLRSDNEEEHELRNIPHHDATPEPEQRNDVRPEQKNDDANPMLQNLNRIRKLKYIIRKKEMMYTLKVRALQRKVNRYRKLCLRLKKRLESPNSKALKLINDKTKITEVKKKVLFGEAMKKTLESNYQALTSKKEKKIFSDHILQQKSILKENKLLSETKNFTVRERDRETKGNYYQNLKQDIEFFFNRDDVSRMTAGKKEYISRNKTKKQRRYLLDSMKNLHKRFEAENTKVSYSYFCKQRPFWVLIPDVSDRETCLCKTHANVELLLKALHSRKIIKEKGAADIVNSLCCSNTSCLLSRCGTCKDKKLEYLLNKEEAITFSKWEHKKETYVTKGVEKTKRVIAKVKVTTSPKEAVAIFESMIPEFLKHEGTRRWQYSALKDLKCNLKKHEAIVHIDFSENYSYKYHSEVQSFHFGGSRKELTLHTAVVYVTNEDDQVMVKSLCTVSENMRHDAAAIWAHIIPVLEYIQATNKNVNQLHILSDSPSSQYRNKTMFYIISILYWNFPNLNLITWNFSEAGHGKGAADGVGGTVKRIADAAVARGKDIENINDFMTIVAQSAENVKLEIVSDYQIFEKDLLIPSEKLRPLKGTNKVHQVLWKKDHPNLIFRELSCFICLSGYCNHVKHVGELNYGETCERITIDKENQIGLDQDNVTGVRSKFLVTDSDCDDDFLIRRVGPKKMLLGKTLRTDFPQRHNSAQEKIKITSNIILKPAQEYNNVTKLSDLQPDNKLHLTPDRNINEMLSLYNISGSTNFSGIFENFLNTSTLKESNFETEANVQVDFDSIPSESKLLLKASNSNFKLRSKQNSSFWMKQSQNYLVPQTPSTSQIDKTHCNKPPVYKNIDLSSSDDDFDIFPPKKF